MERHNLEVCLLGGFRITLNDQLFTGLNHSRQQSLLAYLMLHASAPQLRQHVAFCFWPDSTEERAYANLRAFLHHIRRSCPELEAFLESTQTTLQWCWPTSARVDVIEYESLLTRANTTTDVTQMCEWLAEAANLYRGDLIPGCYDDWLIPVRERLSQSYVQMLQQLVDQLAAREEYQAAIDYASRLRSYDPFREISYRRLMELHEAIGDRAAALRVYHDCSAVLERELGVEPSAETRTVYERIMNADASQARAIQLLPSMTATVSGRRLVGRHEEWRTLQSAWQTARQGEPHLLLISGEGGIGKTHLAEEMVIWASQRRDLTVRTRAFAAEGQLAYALVVEWLRAELYRDKLRTLDSLWLIELARLLPELLSKIPGVPRPTPLTDKSQRQHLFEALAHAALCAGEPLLVVIDDLQWADQESLEWLHFFLRFKPSAPLLIIGTARMEEVDSTHPLSTLLTHLRHAAQLSEIALEALDAKASAQLAQQAAGHALDAQVLSSLYAYAEGVPLFLVEAIRAEAGKAEGEMWQWQNVRAADSTPLRTSLPLPPRVYAMLQARLAQLSSEARRLVDLAAVIGRSFTYELLVQASGAGEAEVVHGLDELWKRRIIRERGLDYEIAHDRIRDVAYAEIAPAQRRLLHRQVAQTLEQFHAADLDTINAQLAWHHENAASFAQAVHYYIRAGMASQRVYANGISFDLFEKGLALLSKLPTSPERDRQELHLQMAKAASLRPKSFLASEVNQALQRALALSRKVGDAKQQFWSLWGLHTYHLIRGEMPACQELVIPLLTIAEKEQDPAILLVAHTVAGGTHFHVGNLVEAHRHFTKYANLYTFELHEEQVVFAGFDYGALCPAWRAHTLWCMGYANRALQECKIALEVAQQLAHPFCQVLALAYLATLHHFRGEREAAQAQAETALALATQHEINYYGSWAAILLQWALASVNPGREQIKDLRAALDAFRADDAGLRWPYYLSLLAEVYLKSGQPTAGLAVIDDALMAAATQNEHWWDAELHRLRGELLFAQGGDVGEIEATFQRALTIAHHQQARALELRAAKSLARLWGASNPTQASQILSASYCHFDEGFDTLDLQDAKKLLAELSNS